MIFGAVRACTPDGLEDPPGFTQSGDMRGEVRREYLERSAEGRRRESRADG
jgi:hypothetical protein